MLRNLEGTIKAPQLHETQSECRFKQKNSKATTIKPLFFKTLSSVYSVAWPKVKI